MTAPKLRPVPGGRSLEGKAAIVTGAGRGLGRSIARTLVDAGARVAVAARSADELDSLVDEVTGIGGEALACPTDITVETDVDRLVAQTVDRFGGVDILVNNSGIVASTPLVEQSADEFDRVVATNLRGVFLATRAVGRHLLGTGRPGKVINIASNFASKGVADHAAYCATKAAVVGFTRSMAIEWARHNIQVNSIAPGYFATPLNAELRADHAALAAVIRSIPARRMGVPEELAPWLLLLAGSPSDFMTGEVIVIDGGQNAR